ncbi:hypothetical protein CFAM422_013087 [Trichoderma lentiforme]|uniref:Uncharacterized protein n=1 Tax=Trichoderma lentiforme TaxID=1567552 RepID=A0A9P4X1D9_9HYPO|nr:hypothetical protein CFAM422_013087 [Trichoderma lentiforme]
MKPVLMPFKPPSLDASQGQMRRRGVITLQLGSVVFAVRHITLCPICTASSYEREAGPSIGAE